MDSSLLGETETNRCQFGVTRTFYFSNTSYLFRHYPHGKKNTLPQDEEVATGNYLSCEAGSPES